jgi:hypothetical protein
MGALIETLRGSWLTRDWSAPQDGAADTAARRIDRVIWTLIAATAAVVVLGAVAGGFSIVWRTFAAPAATGAALTGLAFFYRRRGDARLATSLEGTAQIMLFAAVGAPLSYLAASVDLPLHDGALDALDRALGFDWIALLGFMNAHPALQPAATAVYLSFAPQLTVTVLALGFAGHLKRLRIFVLAFILTALTTIAISGLLPAEGAWTYFGLKTDAHTMLPVSHTSWPVFHALRDGSERVLMATGAEGIITFPSLHAALGVMFALALWPVPALRWIAINLVMLAATPIDGSHYLVDVLAGIVIAAVCWWSARKMASLLRA